MIGISEPLVRFVTEGLTAAIDAHLAGALPLHRFAWELSARVDMLAKLDVPARTLTRLRWLQRTVELLHATLSARVEGSGSAGRSGRTGLTGDEENTLTVTVASLRTVLATLAPHNPLDPAGAARPLAV
jgi:hypothetical protein